MLGGAGFLPSTVCHLAYIPTFVQHLAQPWLDQQHQLSANPHRPVVLKPCGPWCFAKWMAGWFQLISKAHRLDSRANLCNVGVNIVNSLPEAINKQINVKKLVIAAIHSLVFVGRFVTFRLVSLPWWQHCSRNRSPFHGCWRPPGSRNQAESLANIGEGLLVGRFNVGKFPTFVQHL